jgi:hypothetical protein
MYVRAKTMACALAMPLATRKEDRLHALLAHDRTSIVFEFGVVRREESD